MSNLIIKVKNELIKQMVLPDEILSIISSFYFQVHTIVSNTQFLSHISKYQKFLKNCDRAYLPFHVYIKNERVSTLNLNLHYLLDNNKFIQKLPYKYEYNVELDY